jgi:hypothetical protein
MYYNSCRSLVNINLFVSPDINAMAMNTISNNGFSSNTIFSMDSNNKKNYKQNILDRNFMHIWMIIILFYQVINDVINL